MISLGISGNQSFVDRVLKKDCEKRLSCVFKNMMWYKKNYPSATFRESFDFAIQSCKVILTKVVGPEVTETEIENYYNEMVVRHSEFRKLF